MTYWNLERVLAAAGAVTADKSTPESEHAKKGPIGASSPGVYPLAERAQLDEANAEMRKLLQRTGTGLGAAAIAILGGLGYARLHDIFPIPENAPAWTSWATVGAIAAAFLGSAILAGRFFAAQRRVLIGSDLSGLAGPSKKRVRPILRDFANEEEADEIVDIDLRAIRLARIARRLKGEGDPSHVAVQEEADRLGDVVYGALGAASTHLLEFRTRRAFFGWVTTLSLVCAIAGIVASFAFADYFKGQRDLTALRVTCLKDEQAGVIGACRPYETKAQRVARKRARHAQSTVRRRQFLRARKRLSPTELKRLAASSACVKYVLTKPHPKSIPASTLDKLLASCTS